MANTVVAGEASSRRSSTAILEGTRIDDIFLRADEDVPYGDRGQGDGGGPGGRRQDAGRRHRARVTEARGGAAAPRTFEGPAASEASACSSSSSSLEDERQRQFRRFVGISAGVHAALAILVWIGPMSHTGKALPVVERVTLVEALPSAAAPRPKPKTAAPPKPVPPPPPPPEVAKVLPKEPAPLPKPKPVEAKPEPKPEVKPEPKPNEPEPEQNYEDVLAQLRNEAGETPPPRRRSRARCLRGRPAGRASWWTRRPRAGCGR